MNAVLVLFAACLFVSTDAFRVKNVPKTVKEIEVELIKHYEIERNKTILINTLLSQRNETKDHNALSLHLHIVLGESNCALNSTRCNAHNENVDHVTLLDVNYRFNQGVRKEVTFGQNPIVPIPPQPVNRML